MIEGFSDETTRNEIKTKRNSKISEWLNPEPEVKEESNRKYYVIAALLILSCLSWYYWDEIRTVTPTITNYFRRPRPGNDGIGEPNTGMDRGNIQPSLDNKPTVDERLKSLLNKTNSDQSQIELQDNTQNVASTSKLDNSPPSNNSMNHYFSKPVEQQMTGLRDITGQDLEKETKSVVNEIGQFMNYHDNASFPKDVAVSAGIYKLLKDRLNKLMDKNNLFWGEISDDDKIMEKLDRFDELESQFVTQHNSPVVENNNLDNNNQNNNLNNNSTNILDNQSDTYEEVAVANIESRMAWSDRATPSVHSQEINSQIATPSVHSQEISPDQPVTSYIEQSNLESQEVTQQTVQPKSTFANLLDSIRKRRDDSHVVGSPSNKISNLVDNADNLDDTELLEAVKGTLKENVGLKLDITKSPDKTSPVDLPKIDIDSSNSSMEQYFPKPDVTPQDASSTFSNLFSQINSRRDDSNVVGSPQIGQLGLQPSRLSPLNTKPSISNLLEDTQALFDDDDDEIIPTSNFDKGKGREIDENLLSNISDSWDKVETNVQYGDSPTDIIVDLKYEDLWTRISSYRFVMNTGQVIDYPFGANGNVRERSFDLSSRIETDNNSIVELKEIIILDLNYRGNSVWKNSKYSN